MYAFFSPLYQMTKFHAHIKHVKLSYIFCNLQVSRPQQNKLTNIFHEEYCLVGCDTM
jgi:hypothetical protein